MNEQEYREAKQYLEQKAQDQAQIIEGQQAEKEILERKQELKRIAQVEQESAVHSRPVKRAPDMPSELHEALRAEVADILVVGDKDAPPSIYYDLNNKTYLSRVLKLQGDNPDTILIDKFVQTKMRVGKLMDNQENYERVFNNLLTRANLSIKQQKSYLLQKLGIYLNNLKQRYEDEDIDNIIVTLMLKGRQSRGRR